MRAPSWHCRGARVYGHTTTAMHDREYTPLRHLFADEDKLSGNYNHDYVGEIEITNTGTFRNHPRVSGLACRVRVGW